MRRRGFVPQQTINRRMAEKDARFARAVKAVDRIESAIEATLAEIREEDGKQDCSHGQKLGACDRCER